MTGVERAACWVRLHAGSRDKGAAGDGLTPPAGSPRHGARHANTLGPPPGTSGLASTLGKPFMYWEGVIQRMLVWLWVFFDVYTL